MLIERLPFHFEKMGISPCMVEKKLLNILWSCVTWRRGSFQNNHAEWALYHKTPWCYPYQSNWIKSRQRLIYSALNSSLCLTRLVSTPCRCIPPQKEMKSCHCRWSVPLSITNSQLPLDNNKFHSYITHVYHGPAHRSFSQCTLPIPLRCRWMKANWEMAPFAS